MTLNLRELRLKVDEHELEGFEYLWQQHLDTVEVDTQQVTAVEEDASQHLTAAALQVKITRRRRRISLSTLLASKTLT